MRITDGLIRRQTEAIGCRSMRFGISDRAGSPTVISPITKAGPGASGDAFRPQSRRGSPVSTDRRSDRSSECSRSAYHNRDRKHPSAVCHCPRCGYSSSACQCNPQVAALHPQRHPEGTALLFLAFHTMTRRDLKRLADDLVANAAALISASIRRQHYVCPSSASRNPARARLKPSGFSTFGRWPASGTTAICAPEIRS